MISLGDLDDYLPKKTGSISYKISRYRTSIVSELELVILLNKFSIGWKGSAF